MAKAEADIQKAILELLRSMGIFAYRQQTQGLKYSGGRGKNPMKGAPDIAGIIPPWLAKTTFGIPLGIEVKTPEGKLSPEQIAWIENIRANGGIAFVCNDFHQLRPLLNSFLPK